MKRLLQRFRFKENRYERPNQKWVCGWQGEGKECPLGPDAAGACRGSFQCAPVRQGDRWHCTRLASLGGPCEDGPQPDGTCCRSIPKCQPVRSLRAWRGLATWLVVALTVGALAFLVGGKDLRGFISPGPLTSHHGLSELTCSDCHVGASPSAALPVARVIVGPRLNQDSQLCLKCHYLGTNQLQPHGLARPELVARTRRIETHEASARPMALALSSILARGPPHQPAGVNCSVCHSEHRGKNSSLSHLENSQCQSCHARQFASFANGHPSLSAYPFNRRTRIIFDHVSHLEKHFSEAEFQAHALICTDCHEPDAAGRKMLVKSFSVSCANCHARQIEGEGRADAPGIAFFRVPGLDVETLEKRGHRIGDWPTTGDDEGRLTPFMRLLLSAEPTNHAALETLATTDLFDLRKADANVLAATEQLVWAVKELLYEFVIQGQRALEHRLQFVLQQRLSPAQITLLAGQLPRDAILAAQREWFPNLMTEVPRHRRGEKLDATKAKGSGDSDNSESGSPDKPVSADAWVARGGWYRSKNDYALLYRPGGHADLFIQGWLDLAASDQLNAQKLFLGPIFKSLSANKSPGLCMKCHSIDEAPNHGFQVNWWPARPIPNEQLFTKFSHATHFSLLDQKGCQTCHQLDPKAGYQKAFETNLNAAVFTSSFAPMQKSVCSSCHTPHGGGDGCLKCHNYHVGNFAATLPKSASPR